MLRDLFKQYGISASEKQIACFERFLETFIAKNSVINLSAIRAPKDIILKHFIDSLQVLNLKEYQQAKTVIDVGTGGGFPGLPLAIMSPDKQFTLLDSIHKKILCVQEFAQILQLGNVHTAVGRAEEVSIRPEFHKSFDVCVSRSVAYLPKLLTFTIPFIKRNGTCLFYKQESADEFDAAVPALKKLQMIAEVFPYQIEDMRRIIIQNRRTGVY